MLIADLHIHSKYSRACSPELTLENIDKWCRLKGIDLVATGDFTHPAWFKEIEDKLEEVDDTGFLKIIPNTKYNPPAGGLDTRFILGTEVSCIYSQGGKVRRVHLCLFFPNLISVKKFNQALETRGCNIKSDGRPILGLSAKEVLKIIKDIDSRAVMIPAHCLLPDTVIHTRDDLIKKIQNIKVGDEVFTHKNRWRKVIKILSRPYNGKVYHIKPYYFNEGLVTTAEHPFFAIKTIKNCCWGGESSPCKPAHLNYSRCKHKYFNTYKPSWIKASRLENGDVLVFPRFKSISSVCKSISIGELIDLSSEKKGNQIGMKHSRTNFINNYIPITKEFCRLVGYYLAEGYTNDRDAIGFTFHSDEKEYLNDTINLVKEVFGFKGLVKIRQLPGKGKEIMFYSKILRQIFSRLFYATKPFTAGFKALPTWMLGLEQGLQVEILKGWWRGDKGYTSSRTLMNQMKIICLHLGIIPSIYRESKEAHFKRGNHYFVDRKIKANFDCYAINHLSFFEDKFGLLASSEFKQFKNKSQIQHGWLDANYVYLPIRNIGIKNYKGKVYNLEVKDDNSYTSEFATIHNCWTPWFAVFGSKSGFDSLEECFEELTPEIFAVETGLSSDPAMNWRLSALDKVALVSNSDAHSLPNLGREANVFNLDASKTNYDELMKSIKEKNPAIFLKTIEFYPEEGMYHYDGHRLCQTRLKPAETKKVKGICPVCKKEVTIGVLNRVEKLADRPEGFVPPNAVPFVSLVGLDKIIAEALGVKSRQSAKVVEEYEKLLKNGKSEFNILLNLSLGDLKKITLPEVAEGIRRVREKELKIEPGFDGQYGRVTIFSPEEKKERQKKLF